MSEANPVHVVSACEQPSHRRRLRPAPVVLGLALFALGAAHAAKIEVAVLDFRSITAGAPPDFGIAAARLVAAALEGTGKYQVTDYTQVREELAKRRLEPPFGVGHLQMLADVLKVQQIVHGSVRALNYDPATGTAGVTLAIEVVDGASGNLRKHAEGQGVYRAAGAAAVEEPELLLRALTEAVKQVVEDATGATVQATPEEIGAAAKGDTGQAGGPAGGGLAAALLPPVQATEPTPMTATPRADLAAPPSPPSASRISVVVVQNPTTDSGSPAVTPAPTPEAPASPPGVPPPAGRTPRIIEDQPIDEPGTADLIPLIRAKILAKIGADRVLLTLGKDAAIGPKMELDVYRVSTTRDGTTTKRKMGRIRIAKVNPTDAEARILEGAEVIATGDYAYYYGE
jgi:hypothetical protein